MLFSRCFAQQTTDHESSNRSFPRQQQRAGSHKTAARLLGWLKSIGLTPGAILGRSNLPPTVYSGESLVTTAQSFSIWQAIRELCHDPTVGWKFMSQVETDQYHPTLLARTYREAIQKGDEILVEVSWGEPPPALLIDAVFALVTELGRRGTKRKLHPKRIELTRTLAAG